MFTYEENCTINLGDSYTLLYSFIVRRLLDGFGVDGEAAAREGTRRFGRDRALTKRRQNQAAGLKVNMTTLFGGVAGDLPGDPRFRREKQELNPEERVSHTLICPMADAWKAYGEMAIGRMYCEEFHAACYGEYCYNYSRVNLAKTLTQEGDEYCAFNVVLRPQDLPDELKPVCFPEYDPDYVQPKFTFTPATGKGGFNLLSIKLYFYLLDEAIKAFGERGAAAVEAALCDMAVDFAMRMKRSAAEQGLPMTREFVRDNNPWELDPDSDPTWEGYTANNAAIRVKEKFVPKLLSELGLA